jgi:hypothetical protein
VEGGGGRACDEGYDDVVSVCDEYGEWDGDGVEGVEVEDYGAWGVDDSLSYFAAYDYGDADALGDGESE